MKNIFCYVKKRDGQSLRHLNKLNSVRWFFKLVFYYKWWGRTRIQNILSGGLVMSVFVFLSLPFSVVWRWHFIAPIRVWKHINQKVLTPVGLFAYDASCVDQIWSTDHTMCVYGHDEEDYVFEHWILNKSIVDYLVMHIWFFCFNYIYCAIFTEF